MLPRWDPSADKHAVPHEDQAYAIAHASFSVRVEDTSDRVGEVWLFIGPPHPQTDRELEVLVRTFPGTSREAVIFHAMSLGPHFRRIREEFAQ